MRKETSKVTDVKIPHKSDKELTEEWIKHWEELTTRGIIVTFKPSRFYTSRDRLQFNDSDKPPTYKDNNGQPLK